ncbi:MAG TPA: CHAD domain-containing protein [Bryobacteraceae bacterium]|jgi:CHAD domain-containing protein|nr:CHAD domain-containing protein [Bryobacteraceae bacterium]
MPYRFKAKQSIEENVRRIAHEEIDSAVDLLSRVAPRKRDESVHEARKSIKKTRALLRLVAPELGKTFNQENKRFRDTGHQLSVLRDAAALLETVGHIEEQLGASLDRRLLATVRRGLQRQKRELEHQFTRSKTIPRAASALRAAAKRIRGWPLGADGFEAIAPGLKRSYRDGRRALKRAQQKRDIVSYHDLRKRVKDHWYHVRLLESIWTEVMQAHEASLKELETWLGEDHNVSVLREKLEENPDHFGGEQTVRVFLALADQYQKELQEKALALAERVYVEKPRLFLANIAALWDGWQKQPPAMKEVEREQRDSKEKRVSGRTAA